MRDTANLILDRVLDREDLVLFVLDFHQRAVQRRGFTAAGRPSYQHHSIWLADVAAEFLYVALGESDDLETQRSEFLADRFLVENTDDRVFAMNRGHDRYTKVNRSPFVSRLEAAVLRDAPLGNVELRHDFDSRNDRRMVLLRDRRHGFAQRPVDAVLHADFGVSRFDVDVTGAALERGEDDRVHEPDDRTRFFLGDLFDRDGLVTGFVFTYQIELESFRRFFQHPLRGFGFLQQVLNFRKRRNVDDQGPPEKR